MRDVNSNTGTLSPKERELTAIGAAIASNCVPCVEYHIPQAKKVGLSESQILEAIELADKVRRVPADKVIQTACALLEVTDSSERNEKPLTCGCSDTKTESDGGGGEAPGVKHVRLDNPNSNDDNDAKSKSHNDLSGDCCS